MLISSSRNVYVWVGGLVVVSRLCCCVAWEAYLRNKTRSYPTETERREMPDSNVCVYNYIHFDNLSNTTGWRAHPLCFIVDNQSLSSIHAFYVQVWTKDFRVITPIDMSLLVFKVQFLCNLVYLFFLFPFLKHCFMTANPLLWPFLIRLQQTREGSIEGSDALSGSASCRIFFPFLKKKTLFVGLLFF